MTGFLDRLTAHLHGEAPTVAVRPRGPFEPDPGPGPGAWPGADATGPYDDADHRPGRHAASGPWPQPAESGSVDFSLAGLGLAGLGLAGPGQGGPGVTDSGVADSGVADSGVADHGLAGPGVAGSGLGGRGRVGTGLARSGLADLGLAGTDLTDVRGTGLASPGVAGPGLGGRGPTGPGPASTDPGNAGESAVAGAHPGAGSQAGGHDVGWPPDGQSRPAVWPGQPLAPDEGPSRPWSGPALPASSRSRRAPAPRARAAEASEPSAADGAAGVELRPEDEALAPAPSATGTGGAARAAPTVILKDSSGSMTPTAEPRGGTAPPAPPSLDELLARHVVPALRAAGAVRSGRDTVRLTQEPVTERRGGDVHVHLGRIEVVQPPAAAPAHPARSRPRPPAPDHEAYLARRRQDRR